ncbi:MAG: TerB N-terminal domain-containing protein [Phycisphaerae bacterium]|jgi:uncharacterized tellurite resistance protein B-like protein
MCALTVLLALLLIIALVRAGNHSARKQRGMSGPSKATVFAPGRKRPVQWAGASTRVTLFDWTILRPLTYVVRSGKGLPEVDEPSLIDPSLRVTTRPTQGVPPLPYWPSYADMLPEQRAVYLAWMAGGRSQMPPEIGYAFVFFYGLERRVLVDKSDIPAVFDEVMRLRKLHVADRVHFSNSFDGYTSSFLWTVVMAFANEIDEPGVKLLAQSSRSWSEDNTSALLAWFIQVERLMPDWAAYIIASQLPASARSVVVTRVNKEFRELFAKRYQETCGQGLLVRSAKVKRQYTYRAGSNAMRSASILGPNPLGLTSQFTALSDMWNACILDLKKLSTVVNKQSDETLTAERWEVMPQELRAEIDHPLTDAVCRLVEECTNSEGITLITVSKLASLLEYGQKDLLTKPESDRICTTLEYVGYCVEPDSQLTGRAYRTGNTVTAFLNTSDSTTDPQRHRVASVMLRFGISVAAADGDVRDDETKLILQDIENLLGLNEHERKRLDALQKLLLATHQGSESLPKVGKSLGDHTQAVAKMLLALVAQDGVVTESELEAIKKCYRALGFLKQEIAAAIHSLEASRADEEPVTIQPAILGDAGEAIPEPQAATVMMSVPAKAVAKPAFRLNRAAIAAIMQDTQEVAMMLAEAMSAPDANEVESSPFSTPFVPVDSRKSPSTGATTAVVAEAAPAPSMLAADPTVPTRYLTFYQVLISRQEWDMKELDGMARQQGLMLSGAIETLNEWATEKYGGQLFIENGSKLCIEQAYLN